PAVERGGGKEVEHPHERVRQREREGEERTDGAEPGGDHPAQGREREVRHRPGEGDGGRRPGPVDLGHERRVPAPEGDDVFSDLIAAELGGDPVGDLVDEHAQGEQQRYREGNEDRRSDRQIQPALHDRGEHEGHRRRDERPTGGEGEGNPTDRAEPHPSRAPHRYPRPASGSRSWGRTPASVGTSEYSGDSGIPWCAGMPIVCAPEAAAEVTPGTESSSATVPWMFTPRRSAASR